MSSTLRYIIVYLLPLSVVLSIYLGILIPFVNFKRLLGTTIGGVLDWLVLFTMYIAIKTWLARRYIRKG